MKKCLCAAMAALLCILSGCFNMRLPTEPYPDQFYCETEETLAGAVREAKAAYARDGTVLYDGIYQLDYYYRLKTLPPDVKLLGINYFHYLLTFSYGIPGETGEESGEKIIHFTVDTSGSAIDYNEAYAERMDIPGKYYRVTQYELGPPLSSYIVWKQDNLWMLAAFERDYSDAETAKYLELEGVEVE